MKVATFNINNINRRLPNLLAWLRSFAAAAGRAGLKPSRVPAPSETPVS
ncbi:MAG: hypothetical protein ACI4XG_29065 [Bradyrhizobium sp.]